MGVSKFTDEEFLGALDQLLSERRKENPDFTINNVKKYDYGIYNNKKIDIQNRLYNLKKGKTSLKKETIKKLINDYGLVLEVKYIPTEEDYMLAIKEYLKLHPDKTINTIPARATFKFDDGKEINIGPKLQDMKRNECLLSEENMKLLKDEYGFVQEVNVDHHAEDLMDALELYFKENPDNKIDDIRTKANIAVEFNGKKVNLSVRLSRIRNGEELKPKYMKILKEKYNFRTAKEIEEEEKEALINNISRWLEKNPGKTINDMVITDTIENGDAVINIGQIVNDAKRSERRNINNKYIKLLKKKFGLKSDVKVYMPKPEEYIEALDIWLKENYGKTVNDIKEPASPVIISNGRKIELARKICRMRIGKTLFSEEYMLILKEQYGFQMEKNEKETGFVREIEPLKRESKNEVIKEKSYEKYLEEFDGDIEKAKEKDVRVKEINRLIREKRKNKKTEYTINELEKEFNINFEELDKYLSQIKSDSEKDEVLYIDENETLRNYCIRHGYNYSVIYNLIKKSKEFNVPFKQIIREYLENGQKLPTRYVYDKNETLVKHILLDINVDSELVVDDMKHSYTINEAITRDVFRKNIQDKKDKWLELPYTFLIEELGPFSGKSNTNIKFKDFESLLSKQEQIKLMNLYDECSKTLRNYQYLEIGLEKDINKVKELIKKYSLTDDEVTKASLRSMDFENKIKITENRVKSERLRTIEPIIINWSTLNENARNKLIKSYELTKEEIEMIINYNKKIEYNLKLYKELLKENNVTEEEIETIRQYHKNLFYNMNLYR